ncbi:MAG TPA: carboxypeptidase-like regulatory domain-containing protein, partial [Thermoanaerobaculia bacterium]|nr:carboxypeptidase-like regulatory domain-containing protein [Thermoanaerobaculia bacterium]
MALTRGAALGACLLLFTSAPLAQLAPPSTGTVRLGRAEYDKLKDESDMPARPRKKPQAAPPLVDAARYELVADEQGATLELTAEIVVKGPFDGEPSRLALPLSGHLDTLSDSGPVPMLVFHGADGRVTLGFSEAGRWRVTARSLLEPVESAGARAFSFTSLPAASVRLAASSPLRGATFEVSSGGGAEPLAPGAVRILPASASVTVRLRAPARTAAADKPVVIAETVDVVRPERERVFVRTVLHVGASRADISEVTFRMTPGGHVISTDGPDEPSLEYDEKTGSGHLRFGTPVRGDAIFSILTWRAAPNGSEPFEVAPTRVADAAANRSFVLVTPGPAREHVPVSNAGLARTDATDLPLLARPFVEGGTRAYRGLDARALLVFSAPLRALVAPADTLVYDASLLTVFGDGGIRTDRRRFALESRRPFFTVPLDAREEVVSVSVDGAPARPQTDAGALVVVLSAAAASNALRTVEVTTKRKDVEVPKSGELLVDNVSLPASTALATWTLVLPEARRYRYVSSSGLRKVAWNVDAPAVVTKSQTRAADWIAPTGDATVSGQVTDSSGGGLPGVSVELRSSSGAVRTAVSDASGKFRLAELPSGPYQLATRLSGFKSTERKVTLGAGTGVFVPVT